MNRRKLADPPLRPTLQNLLKSAHLRVALLSMLLTGLSLTLVSLIALSAYAGHNLKLVARSLAYTLEAAVVFSDRDAVNESISLITAQEDIAHLVVTGRNDLALADWNNQRHSPLASLERTVADLMLPQPLTQPILHQGRQVGELTLSGQGTFLLRFLLTVLLGILICLTLAALGAIYGSRRMRHTIVAPLHELSRVARAIARDRTFSLRAPGTRISELNELAEDFNSLLDELESWQSQLERENASLAHQASHDVLTGLPNRAQFEANLFRAVRSAREHKGRLAVLFLDSNGFKQINDQLGHAAGDAVLVSIAQRLGQQLRESDLVARLGGDEFVVLIEPIHQPEDAVQVADKILASMKNDIYLPDGNTITTSLSVGIALYPEHADTPNGLIHVADVAMYHAKRNRLGRHVARTHEHSKT